MRTDSVKFITLAIEEAKKLVTKNFGEAIQIQNFNTKSKGAQQAHEVRPTKFDLFLDIINDYDQKRLYELILNRTLASQMNLLSLKKQISKFLIQKILKYFLPVER